jgi:hypothetical protein
MTELPTSASHVASGAHCFVFKQDILTHFKFFLFLYSFAVMSTVAPVM